MPDRTPAFITTLALLLVLAAAVPFVVGAQQSGQVVGEPQLSASTSAGSLVSGTTTEVSLAVTNRARIERAGPEQYEQRVTTARGVVARIESGDTPIRVNTGSVALGTITDGTTAGDAVSLTVPEGTEPGTYELPVEYEYGFTRIVDYGNGSPSYSDITRTQEGTLEVTVDDRPTFEVVNRSSGALVGQTGQVELTMRNAGTEPATDARVTITSGSNSMTFGSGGQSATNYAGQWAVGETKTVGFEGSVADDADPGTYSADVSVSYTDAAGIQESSPGRTVGVPVGDEQSFALRDVESTLRAGYEGQLTGTLVNEGPNTARNPVAALGSNSESLTVTDGEEALPDLAPGDSTEVAFSVDAAQSGSAGQQQFEIAVDYDTALGDRRTASAVRPTVQVRPPQDRFLVEAVNGTVTAGEGRTLELEVTNRGDEALQNVQAKAYPEAPLSSGDDEAIVAELAPGETATMSMDLAAASGANPKDYPLELDFQYQDPDGQTETSGTYTVPIGVTPQESGGGPPLLLIVGVLVLVAGAVYLYRRRS